jgi:hypothetical protein
VSSRPETDTLSAVRSLFRRKPADLVSETTAETQAETEAARPKGYTPSKRERGVTTPKRGSADRRRISEPAPTSRREAYRRARERSREDRKEAAEGMRRGDERYLLPRDRGPERALVRDVVDSRRTVGTWFFGGAVIVIIGSWQTMPVVVQLASNLLWAVLALAVVVDSLLIARRIKRFVGQRFPKTTQRMRSLYFYGIMRGLTFRGMRVPKPRVAIGATP